MKTSSIAKLVLAWFAFASPVAAFNNDGYPDIYWHNPNTLQNQGWWLNGQKPSSSPLPSTSVDLPENQPDGYPWKIGGEADFDGDGQLDIVWYEPLTGRVAYWYMNGAGVKSTALVNGLAGGTWDLVGTGYFDGPTDKHPDLLWYNYATGQVAVWHMNNLQSLNPHLVASAYPLTWKIGGTADMDHDGTTDIIWRNEDPSDGRLLYWKINRRDTTRAPSDIGSFLAMPQQDPNFKLVAATTFNSNGQVDLLWRIVGGSDAGKSSIWFGPTYTTAAVLEIASNLDWAFAGLGDSQLDGDGDGIPDVWERNWFGQVGTASGDPDGDSWTNLQEFRNGTNPTVYDQPLFYISQEFEGIDQSFYDDYGTVNPDPMGAAGRSGTLPGGAQW